MNTSPLTRGSYQYLKVHELKPTKNTPYKKLALDNLFDEKIVMKKKVINSSHLESHHFVEADTGGTDKSHI